jgi:hypothetical protein
MYGKFTKEIHQELILSILELTGCETFLELGVQSGMCLINATRIVKRAIGVDIKDIREQKVGEFYECTTDEFFKNFTDNVDIVFIDADHHFESARKDFENSLKLLNKNGIIIIHDTDPMSKDLLCQTRCGDSYKIINYIYNNHKELDIITLPLTLAGLSIIKRKDERRVLDFIPEDLFGFNILNKDVTLLITSCDRTDLLKITLESFTKFNTYPIHHVIIIEDSGKKGINDFILSMFNCPVTLIYNEKRIGQMKSIEKASSFITTPYVFHCEDDWEFYKPNFIEESFKILDKDPKVTCVFLNHSIIYYNFCFAKLNSVDMGDYFYVQSNNDHRGGFTWNPSLRRTDIQKFKMPYKDEEDEGTLSEYYQSIGMICASTKNLDGFVYHIGNNRHVY